MSQTENEWVCECRRCNGVFNSEQAVQYVWEWALGSCGVPVVVSVNACADGHVVSAFTYWHDEPDQPEPMPHAREYIVSCRPGQGTIPTEGDVARWTSWQLVDAEPADWLLVDGQRFRSVKDCVDALCNRLPIAAERLIAGDWLDDEDDRGWRVEIRSRWAETKKRNRQLWRL